MKNWLTGLKRRLGKAWVPVPLRMAPAGTSEAARILYIAADTSVDAVGVYRVMRAAGRMTCRFKFRCQD